MTVYELNEEQFEELRAVYLKNVIVYKEIFGVPADNLVTDEQICRYYDGWDFREHDFKCSKKYSS